MQTPTNLTLSQIRRMSTRELEKLADAGNECAMDELAERGAERSYRSDEPYQW